jgi:hypothetical protein
VAQAGVALAVVEVDPWVLPTGAGAQVGGEPIAAADAGAEAAAADEAGRWDHDGTPPGTLEGHYSTELPQPSSVMMTLLMKSGNDPLVLSVMRFCSLVERPIIKWSFFLSFVSTWSGVYYVRWLNNFE